MTTNETNDYSLSQTIGQVITFPRPAPPPLSRFARDQSADEREAALLSRLSRKVGRRVIRDEIGIFGYHDDAGDFIELG